MSLLSEKTWNLNTFVASFPKIKINKKISYFLSVFIPELRTDSKCHSFTLPPKPQSQPPPIPLPVSSAHIRHVICSHVSLCLVSLGNDSWKTKWFNKEITYINSKIIHPRERRVCLYFVMQQCYPVVTSCLWLSRLSLVKPYPLVISSDVQRLTRQ